MESPNFFEYTNIYHAISIDFPVDGGEITIREFFNETPLGSPISRGWMMYNFKDLFDYEFTEGYQEYWWYGRGYGQNFDSYDRFKNSNLYGFPGVTQRLEPPCNKVTLFLQDKDRAPNFQDFETTFEVKKTNDSTYILTYATSDLLQKFGFKVMVNWKEIMYWYRFEIREDTIQHLDESIISVHAVDNLQDGNDVYIPDATKVDFSIGEGYENFGSLINLDGMPSKVIKGVSYGAAKSGQIRYKADGDIPLEEQNIPIIVRASEDDYIKWGWNIGNICLRPRSNKYRITIEPDSITHGNSAAIFVREINEKEEVVDTPGDAELIFSLDPEGRKYGSLRLADSTLIVPGREINYSVVHAGGVKYFADGEMPDSVKYVFVTVTNADDITISGKGSFRIFPSPEIEILDAEGNIAETVKIGLWENAYSENGKIKNDFINLDPDRFYIQVKDFSVKSDKITLTIGTVGTVIDQSNAIEIMATDKSGVFMSESQLLTSENLGGIPDVDEDDGYQDNNCGIDESLSDRTHKVGIGGKIIIEYNSINGLSYKKVVDFINEKTLKIQAYIFIEPFEDLGYDHDINKTTPDIGNKNQKFDFNDLNSNGKHDPGEPSERYLDISAGFKGRYRRGNDRTIIKHGDGRSAVTKDDFVNMQIIRANISWAQAGIRIVNNDSPIFLSENPCDPGGRDIFIKGTLNPREGVNILFTQYKNKIISNVNIAYVFFTPPLLSDNEQIIYNGVAYHPGMRGYDDVYSHCYVSGLANITYRTLAHELGHLLTRMSDKGYSNPSLFFPREKLTENQMKDIVVENNRRIPRIVVDNAINNDDLIK
jgi:hypothetical protein